MQLVNHDLVPGHELRNVRYTIRPILDAGGQPVKDLHQIWIAFDNERQLNSYTTAAVKDMILGLRRASVDRQAVCVVVTAVGERAFCTGGNTEEYATYYANRPLEYLQYMRLFNDMVTSILLCDKPVICRVNGMRIGGGQEIGMACDFSIAGDHARFGQAGPKHGSAPDGGSTDFLDEYVGFARAVESLVFCEPWSAHKAIRVGLINEITPVHRSPDGKLIPNPYVVTDRYIDEAGRIVYGEWKEGAGKDAAKALAAQCTIDLKALDEGVDRLATKLLYTFPDCTRKTLESVRKKKLAHWQQNSESNRSWLALNMNAEAAAGFPAFHFGDKNEREIDFVQYRRRLAEGARIDDALIEQVLAPSARKREPK